MDACAKAERVLAYAISSAHIIGLHRSSFYRDKSIFVEEMYVRVWWALYLQDRRLSLESGRPFLIQDANVETRMPLELSDDWLAQHKSSTISAVDLTEELDLETMQAGPTSVPYFKAYISLCQITTDVWKVVYSNKQSSHDVSNTNHEYLDVLLDNW